MTKCLFPLWITILLLLSGMGSCYAGTSGGERGAMMQEKEREDAIIQWISANGNPALGKAVAEALQSVEQHPYQHLERGLRVDICRRLTEYDQGLYGNRPLHSSRVFLAEKQLALIKPLWNSTWQEDTTVTALIGTFSRVAKAERKEEKAALLADWEQEWVRARTWTQQTWLKDTNHQIHRFPESLVGLSGAAALVVAGEGAIRPEQASHIFERDMPEQFWYEDMDFYAAAAYAGGLPYQLDGFAAAADPKKYRKYWRWWLLEALPESLANIQKGYTGMAENCQQGQR